MAEAKKNYANIENIDALIGDGVGSLIKNVQITEKKVGDILKKLSALEAESFKREQAQNAESESVAPPADTQEREEIKVNIENQTKAPEAVKEVEQPVQETANIPGSPVSELPAEKEVKKAQETAEKEAKEPAAPVVVNPKDSGTSAEASEREKSVKEKTRSEQKEKESRPSLQTRADGLPSWNRGQYQPREVRATYSAVASERPPRQQGSYTRNDRQAGYNNRAQGATQSGQGRFGTPRTQNGAGTRPAGAKFSAPAPVMPVAGKNAHAAAKKKTFEKTYTEQKKTVSKRALVKQQVSVNDFDEDKSGYRKLRVKKQKQQTVQTIKIDHAVVTSENIPLKVLSEKLGITAVEITKRLFKEGIAKTINDSLDYDTAAYIASDLGIELEYKPEKTAEEVLSEIYKSETSESSNRVVRPPACPWPTAWPTPA